MFSSFLQKTNSFSEFFCATMYKENLQVRIYEKKKRGINFYHTYFSTNHFAILTPVRKGGKREHIRVGFSKGEANRLYPDCGI